MVLWSESGRIWLASAGRRLLPASVFGMLGDLGGRRVIVANEIEYKLAGFDINPRMSEEWIDRVRHEIVRRALQVADQVKDFQGR